MRRLMVLALTLTLGACTTSPTKQSEPVEFEIQSVDSDFTVRSTHLREDFQESTLYGPIEPEVVLILVPSKGTQKEFEQNRELEKVDSEARTFIGVIADLSGEREHYYHVDVETAKRLYQGRTKGFHILLLDSNGHLIVESDEVLPAEVIRSHFPIDPVHEGPPREE